MRSLKSFIIRFCNGEIIKADKLLHFAYSYIIATWFNSDIISMLSVIILGVFKELFDKYVRKTKFDIADILFGIAGGVTYLIIKYLLLWIAMV